MSDPIRFDFPGEAELIKRVLRSFRPAPKARHPLWVYVSELFALGSTYSCELCRRYGFDPDTKVASR